MSAQQPDPPRNGQKPTTWVGLLHTLALQPAQFLLLAALVAGFAWFIDREFRHRETVLTPLFNACLKVLDRDPLRP